MAFKIILLAAVVAVAQAVVVPGGIVGPGLVNPYGIGVARVGVPAIAKVAAPIDDYDPNPQYSYSYDIADALTGDVKNQQESRSGDVVQGSYSLIEPDGTRRIVEYTADPVQGFNAVVHKEPVATKVVAPVAKVGIASPYLGHGLVGHGLVGQGLVGHGLVGHGGIVAPGYGGYPRIGAVNHLGLLH